MISQAYFDYFEDLSKNNDREWFNANKKRYEQQAKEPFIQLVEQIIAGLSSTEPDLALTPVKQMLFRVNRDTRFSKDKRPYKEHLSAVISRLGTKDKIYPGHYFQLSPHESFIAGGAYWFEEKDMLMRVRRFIMDNEERFSEIINDENFKNKWGEIKGEKNKRFSGELAEAIEFQPLIANNQFYWMHHFTPQDALKEDFVKTIVSYFEAAQPMNEFLKEAMYL